ncbi:hypothetical protein DSL72_006871 [Monilinia vaccinii-corymbosi]|uniref:Uncharacterized protein n=1 Tax=Monilinia vaccinii-corymbosi TaxID=61207 RepID=A0A8A3PLA3_9HELO|nr:hypothetical protein DSL72_006871 [Monilinia vaccinii-corymbosi]
MSFTGSFLKIQDLPLKNDSPTKIPDEMETTSSQVSTSDIHTNKDGSCMLSKEDSAFGNTDGEDSRLGSDIINAMHGTNKT